MPKALKSCPKCNKSPNVVTLLTLFPFSLSLALDICVYKFVYHRAYPYLMCQIV